MASVNSICSNINNALGINIVHLMHGRWFGRWMLLLPTLKTLKAHIT